MRDYKNVPNRKLERKLRKNKKKKKRNGCLGTIYTAAAVGSLVATTVVGPASVVAPTILGSVSAATLSSVAVFDCLYENRKIEIKNKAIETILKERHENEIYFYDNKASLGIKH